jgi:prevent-host-death family protein
MAEITTSEAMKRFEQVLEMAKAEPVHVRNNGRDVAVVVSSEQYGLLVQAAARPTVRPIIEELLAKSIKERGPVYKALAK